MTRLQPRRPWTEPGTPRSLQARPHAGAGVDVAETAITSASGRPPACLGLTTREAQVALWVSRGKTNHEIGLILAINVRTVEKHVEHILEKLAVENRTTAALVVADGLRLLGHT